VDEAATARATDAPQVGAGAPRHPWAALALLVPAPTIGACAAFWWWPGGVGQAVYAVAKLWAVALPLWWMLGIDRGRVSWSPPRRGGFGLGIALGLAMSAAIGLAYWLLGDTVIDAARLRAAVAANGLDHAGIFIGGALYWITVNSVLEEYVFRWFITAQFAARLPRGAAVVASGLAFTLHHTFVLQLQSGPLLALLGSLGVFIGGTTWSWLYARTGSVWPGYVSHAIVDLAIFAVGAAIIFGG